MIIIFRGNLTAAAILDIASVRADVRDAEVGARLQPLLNEMAAGKPAHLRVTVQEGDVRQVGYEDIAPADPRFEEALAFDLGTRGLSAIVVDASLRPLFDLLDTDKFTTSQRRQILAILRNLPVDKAQAYMHSILAVADLSGQLDGVRRDWDAFTGKKI
jgi:hypothetical protein